mgnify:CR=1 FL=1
MPPKKRKKQTEEISNITESSTENTISESMKMEEDNNEEIQKPKRVIEKPKI